MKPVQAFLEAREKPRLFSLIWEAQGIGLGLNKVDVKLPPTLTFLSFFFFFVGGGGGGGGGRKPWNILV